MHWEKTITVRITIRQIVGLVLAASAAVNLFIVGVVFGAESQPTTSTVTVTTSITSVSLTSFATTTFVFNTATAEETLTSTPDITPTDTLTPTQTPTHTPGLPICVKRYDWPTYQVQRGNTLFSLAAATGSTVQELMQANCLATDVIYSGQLLYVPRLPLRTFTATPTATPSPTGTSSPAPTATPSSTATTSPTPTDTATPTPTGTPRLLPTATPTSTATPTWTYTPTDTPVFLFGAQP